VGNHVEQTLALDQWGDQAIGTQTWWFYSPFMENEVNQAFVEAYEAAYDEPPTVFGMTTYDTANVLADALAEAGGLSGDELSAALEGLGEIEDSPRGPWSFENQTPRQHVYLRRVEDSGGTLVNAIVQDLGLKSQPAA
jgi:branched-chain amino acid transport system substrate-binding protein